MAKNSQRKLPPEFFNKNKVKSIPKDKLPKGGSTVASQGDIRNGRTAQVKAFGEIRGDRNISQLNKGDRKSWATGDQGQPSKKTIAQNKARGLDGGGVPFDKKKARARALGTMTNTITSKKQQFNFNK